MRFDYYTMMFFISITTLLIVLLYLFFIFITKRFSSALLYFTIGKTLQAFSIIGIALRGQIPDFVSVEISNVALTLGTAIELIALLMYRNNFRKQVIISSLAIAILGSTLFIIFSYSFVYRSSISAATVAILCAITGVELLLTRQNYKFPWLIAFSIFTYGIGRFLWLIQASHFPADYVPEPTQTIDFMTLMFSSFSIIHGVGFLLLVKEVDIHELYNKNKMMHVSFEQSPLGIAITNLKGNIEYANPKLLELTGYTAEELITQTAIIFKSGKTPKATIKSLWETILEKKVWHGEFINKRKNGEYYIEESVIAPVTDDKGKIIKFIAIKKDISQRKEMEELIKVKNKELEELNTSKNKLFSIISHDLRGPIGNIVTMLEIIQESVSKENKKLNQFIEIILETSKNSFQLLENLLDWARSQLTVAHLSKTELNLKEIIDEILAIYTSILHKKEIQIAIEIPQIVKIYADENTIKTVFRNLISNAIKYSHQGSQIIINCKQAEKEVFISIIDQGVGIEKERLDKLFDVKENKSTYGTSGEKGTGLGLLLIKEFVEANDGKLYVESELNKGSSFTFSIPTTQNEQK